MQMKQRQLQTWKEFEHLQSMKAKVATGSGGDIHITVGNLPRDFTMFTIV